MDRIDFFGSAVFVPIFLVSVGLLLDPSVMVEGETLKLAGLFVLASFGGKAASAGIARLWLGYSGSQAELMLGLTVPQAAATLAATIVGFNVGLFDQSVVNAALVLILVSIVLGTFLVDRSVPKVPAPEGLAERVGARILVVLADPGQARLAFGIAARIAAGEGGVVRGLLARPRELADGSEADLAQLEAAAYEAGLDAEPRLLIHDSLTESVVNTATEARASLVLVGRPSVPGASPFGDDAEAIAAGLAAPVAILVGSAETIREVEVVREAGERPGGSFDADGLAIDLARRIAGAAVEVNDLEPAVLARPRAGQLRILPATSWQLLAGTDEPAREGAVLILPES
jgi:hypothetical protein